MIPFEAVIPIILAEALLGIAVMVNVWKNQRCRWCPHCIRLDQDEAARDRKERHERHHRFAGTNADDCSDRACKGR